MLVVGPILAACSIGLAISVYRIIQRGNSIRKNRHLALENSTIQIQPREIRSLAEVVVNGAIISFHLNASHENLKSHFYDYAILFCSDLGQVFLLLQQHKGFYKVADFYRRNLWLYS